MVLDCFDIGVSDQLAHKLGCRKPVFASLSSVLAGDQTCSENLGFSF